MAMPDLSGSLPDNSSQGGTDIRAAQDTIARLLKRPAPDASKIVITITDGDIADPPDSPFLLKGPVGVGKTSFLKKPFGQVAGIGIGAQDPQTDLYKGTIIVIDEVEKMSSDVLRKFMDNFMGPPEGFVAPEQNLQAEARARQKACAAVGQAFHDGLEKPMRALRQMRVKPGVYCG